MLLGRLGPGCSGLRGRSGEEVGHTEPPFIGRAEELRRATLLLQAAAAGKGHVLMVKGETGVGKSRFVFEMVRAGGTNAQLLIGRCMFQEAGDPYAPITDPIVKYRDSLHQASDTPGAAAAEATSVFDGPVGLLGVTGAPVLGLGGSDDGMATMGLLGIGSDTLAEEARAGSRRRAGDVDFAKERDRMFSAVVDVLQDLARERPLVLFIDDLQWAHPAAMQLLAYIARLVGDLPVLLVGAYRTDEVEAAPVTAGGTSGEMARPRHPLKDILVRVRRESPLTEIGIFRLTQPDTAAMAAGILGVPALPADLAVRLFQRTEGTPLFLEELMRGLLANGTLLQGQVPGKIDLDAIKLPQTVADLLGTRLAAVGAEDRKVLDVAALIGEVFDLPILGAVTGVSEDDLVEVIDRLQVGGQISEAPAALRGAGDRYQFTHKLLRETAYQTLSGARRRLLHKKVAQALEARMKGTRADTLYALAHHYSLGQEPEKAIAYSMRAAAAARASFAADEAIGHLQRALEFLDRVAPESQPAGVRKAAIGELADLAYAKGDFTKAAKWGADLERLAAEAGDTAGLSRALRLRGHLERLKGSWQNALKAYEGARAAAQQAGDPESLEEAELGIAQVQIARGEFVEAERALRTMLESSRGRKDRRNAARALIELSTVASGLGETATVEEVLAEGIRELEAVSDPFLLAGAHWSMGEHHGKQGSWEIALASYQKCRELAAKSGDLRLRGNAMAAEAMAQARRGETQNAIALCEQAFQLLARGSDKEGLCRLYHAYGAAYSGMQEWAKASIQLQQALNIAEDLDQPATLTALFLDLGALHQAKGDRKGAVRFLRRALITGERHRLQPYVERIRPLLEQLEKEAGAAPEPSAPAARPVHPNEPHAR